jgi:hypothetical protein
MFGESEATGSLSRLAAISPGDSAYLARQAARASPTATTLDGPAVPAGTALHGFLGEVWGNEKG